MGELGPTRIREPKWAPTTLSQRAPATLALLLAAQRTSCACIASCSRLWLGYGWKRHVLRPLTMAGRSCLRLSPSAWPCSRRCADVAVVAARRLKERAALAGQQRGREACSVQRTTHTPPQRPAHPPRLAIAHAEHMHTVVLLLLVLGRLSA